MTSKNLRAVIVATFAAVIALVAVAETPSATLVNDGHMYMEMARAMTDHGTLEVENGLSVHDSNDLYLFHTIKRGPHLYAKYPPLYAVIAAPAYAAAKIHGLVALNAASLTAIVLLYYALARRLLSSNRAIVSALLLPFAVPLYPYAVMVLPHLLAAALLLGAVVVFERVLRPGSSRRALLLALVSGLLAGLSMGVRVQNLIPGGILILAAMVYAPRKGLAVAGLGAGQAACAGAMSAFNLQRFGAPNPFSYGPSGLTGAPSALEASSYFATPARLVMFILVALSVVVARRHTPARRIQTAAVGMAMAGLVVGVPDLRQLASNMGMTTFGCLVNATAFFGGWMHPNTTFTWINKPLLASAPLLTLGVFGVIHCATRRAPPILTTMAWMTLAVFTFMSIRDPDPEGPRANAVIGWFSLSPRYLVDVMPLMFLLAVWMLRKVRADLTMIVLGSLSAILFCRFYIAAPPDDMGSPDKIALFLSGSIALAALVAALYWVRRFVRAGPTLVLICTVATMYTITTTLLEDTRAYLQWGAVEERWTNEVAAVTPKRFVLVGWAGYRDAIFALRTTKDVVWVDAAWDWPDNFESLVNTLHAFAADGRPIYYFGPEIDRMRRTLEREYDIVPALDDLLFFRLDPRKREPEHVN